MKTNIQITLLALLCCTICINNPLTASTAEGLKVLLDGFNPDEYDSLKIPETININLAGIDPFSEDDSGEDDDDILVTEELKRTSNFECKLCKKTFAQKNNLNRHKLKSKAHLAMVANCQLQRMHRSYYGEKPFECKICGKNFRRADTLDAHELIHTGEKPFACTICGDRFTEKSNCTRHERTHSGEKPFKCDQCDKKFGRLYDLARHMSAKSSHSSTQPVATNAKE